ncbi:hypothetical protein SDC9_45969 [bioreactor metagenome]|uniref:RNA-binding S4 domain-containing protein n=1 Tax=bioreactor metagenome TaxID=1076179 RepID=A0A644W840_9ZZZZ
MAFDPQSAPFSLEGGYSLAERKIAWFGEEASAGWRENPPIACLRISPIAPKFADSLTHRDFLGALMSLGVRRSVLGDILIADNCGFLFCLESISSFLTEQLTQIRHTTVRCSPAEPPEVAVSAGTEKQIVVASERLDALVASVYDLSRSESQELFSAGRLFVNSRMIENASRSPAPGDIISVRGYGRFRYLGIEAETKRGRLRVTVEIY